jgi:hypothetical protein
MAYVFTMATSSLYVCLLLYLFLSINAVRALCYFPDGETIAIQDTPCYSGEPSFCCGQGFACMSNSLCKLTDYVVDAGSGQSTFVRGSCSDKAWGSSCPNFCVTSENGDTLAGAMGLAQCVGNPIDRYYCLDQGVDTFTSSVTDKSVASSMLCTSYSAAVIFQG